MFFAVKIASGQSIIILLELPCYYIPCWNYSFIQKIQIVGFDKWSLDQTYQTLVYHEDHLHIQEKEKSYHKHYHIPLLQFDTTHCYLQLYWIFNFLQWKNVG